MAPTPARHETAIAPAPPPLDAAPADPPADPPADLAASPVTRSARLAEFLAHEEAACPLCGYGLRGLKAARCPECDAPLHLGILSDDARLRLPWFLTAIVSISLGLGFDAVVSLLLIVIIIDEGAPPPPVRPFVLAMWALALLCGLALTVLCRMRRRFARLAPVAQRRLAVGTFCVVFGVHLAYGVTFWWVM
ncbi:MAG TPA: hypothetical protein VD963_11440 [Phycisphaerales bacterium]|nr:hypothetical protein [Phycisphaerales bacterium]